MMTVHEEATHAADGKPSRGIHWLRGLATLAIALLSAVHLSLFWVRLPTWLPDGYRQAVTTFHRTADQWLGPIAQGLAAGGSPMRWTWALTGFVMALVVPWLILAVAGRGRPSDIGLRVPNRVGWRLLLVTYLGALPSLVWLASSPVTRGYYLRELGGQSFVQFICPMALVMLAEHFYFQGALLAALRPGRRWPRVPEPAVVEGGRLRRVLRWLGLAQPPADATGLARWTRWIGLPDGCVLAIVLQTILFGLVHFGKAPDGRELLLSFPGGLALAYVAYRCNSWLVPMLLHAATGGTVLVLVRLWPD